MLGRAGGEECAILLSETGADAGVCTADRRRVVSAAAPGDVVGEIVRVTFSVLTCALDDMHPSIDGMLKLADGAVYEAKRGGRNRVVFFVRPA